MSSVPFWLIPDHKYPFKPGLSLEQAQELSKQIKERYGEQIAAAKNIENRLGCNRTFPDYLGKR